MEDDNYVIACGRRREEANFWWMKANRYADLLEEADVVFQGSVRFGFQPYFGLTEP